MLMILSRNWWMLALRGFAAVILGLAMLIWPGISLTVFALLFGAYALVDGIFAVIVAIWGRYLDDHWWVLLLEGLAGIAVGVLTFIWPQITTLALLYLIAAWSIVTGMFEIVAAIELSKQIEGEWLLFLEGVLSVLFGGLLIAAPGAGALGITWMLGVYAIIFGAMFIVLAFRVRNFGYGTTRHVS